MKNGFQRHSKHNRKYDKKLHIRKNKSTYVIGSCQSEKMIDTFKILSLPLD